MWMSGFKTGGRGGGETCPLYTVEPRFNEPLYTKVLGIMNNFLIFFSRAKITIKCVEQNLDIMNIDLTKSLL